MSLTSMLSDNAEVKSLFSTLPNFKGLCKTLNDDGAPFPKGIPPVADLVQGANAGNVGMAYDYWLRAYLQRINQDYEEPVVVADQAMRRLILGLTQFGMEDSLPEITEKYNISREIRRQYSRGDNVDERGLYEACVFLGYMEAYYRSGYVRQNGYDVDSREVHDLSQIADKTMDVEAFFKKENRILYNPTFGDMSALVGGADADFVIDTMLVDIKTVRRLGYQAEHMRQLIGYYILSKFDRDFPVEIGKIGVFFSRFNRFVYLTIADIKTVFDLDEFAEKFIGILQKQRSPRVENKVKAMMTKDEEAQERIAEVTFKRALRHAGHIILNQYADDEGLLVDKRNNRPVSRATITKAVGGKRIMDLALEKGLLHETVIQDKSAFVLDMSVLRLMSRDRRLPILLSD
ncbi:hypothetical protein [Ferroacidibacillus organovorans]|uniref:Uncharacterized protein n=1 Tax=Ferroacidibacillus organovorans TaxID=1765683 RepID=A0A853KA23_9BACL|nr:hypothetical protein [Ferroacidibacillus organovorans]KYP81757.1 hypothetical protein AYJ22_05850 [Ferroacidibacillus organovorans]OAG93311.1 hypothetical protein AYW79_11395 [Ferroacidibacillus organovorans]